MTEETMLQLADEAGIRAAVNVINNSVPGAFLSYRNRFELAIALQSQLSAHETRIAELEAERDRLTDKFTKLLQDLVVLTNEQTRAGEIVRYELQALTTQEADK